MVEEYCKNIFMLSVIHNPCKNAKQLFILMKKYTFSLSHNNHVDDEEKNIGEKQKIYNPLSPGIMVSVDL